MSLLALLVIAAALFARPRTRRADWQHVVLLGLLAGGGIAAFDGFRLAVREEWRQRYGATTTGIVASKLTDNSEALGGQGARPSMLPRGLGRADRSIARWVRTRSTDVWWIGFEYPSGGTLRQGGDTVSRETWAALQPGQRVAVRFDPSRQDFDRAALDGESDLPDAFAQAAVGSMLIGMAALFSRLMKPRKAQRRLSATALVTDVKSLAPKGRPTWQIEFAFLDDEGVKHECAQEFLRDIWKRGHEGLAEYEPGRPHDAVLIPVPALMARGPLPSPEPAGVSPPLAARSGAAAAAPVESEPLHRRLVPALAWAGVWALVLAATGFVASIAGWTMYYPGSPQGPLHAVLVAAPGGAIAGAFLGAFIPLVRPRWSWMQVCAALAVAVAIYAVSLIDGWQQFGG